MPYGRRSFGGARRRRFTARRRYTRRRYTPRYNFYKKKRFSRPKIVTNAHKALLAIRSAGARRLV